MTDNEITYKVIGSVYKIHHDLGPGLLESTYKKILLYELNKDGLKAESEVRIPIVYDGKQFDEEYRADIIVEGRIILELKSVLEMKPVFHKQLLTYLRLSHLRLGLLINFGENEIKKGIHRVVNGY